LAVYGDLVRCGSGGATKIISVVGKQGNTLNMKLPLLKFTTI
jgi:hypothetical protein